MSQFTLLARTKKGTKPDFHGAMNPEEAAKLYHQFVQKVRDDYDESKVKDGKFQAMMEVALVNDGPVSLSRLSLAYFRGRCSCYGCHGVGVQQAGKQQVNANTCTAQVTLELQAGPKVE